MSNDFVWDKVVGIVMMITNLCCAGTVIALAMGATALGFAGGLGGALAVGSVAGILALLIAGSAILSIAAGYGVMQSQRWGFILGAIVFGLAALSNGSTGNGISVGLDLVAAIYCVLRLTGNVGPRVRS